jgi:hypothetical protein
MAAWGQTEPSGFVAGTAELASIADAGEAWWPSTVRPCPSGDGCSPETGRLVRRPSAQQRAMHGRRQRCKRNLTISEAFGCGHVFGL